MESTPSAVSLLITASRRSAISPAVYAGSMSVMFRLSPYSSWYSTVALKRMVIPARRGMPVLALKSVLSDLYFDTQMVALTLEVILPPGVSLPVSSR